MDIDVRVSKAGGEPAGKELAGRSVIDDADFVMLFPTASHSSCKTVKQTVQGLDVSCPVAGTSVGGFASPGTDGFTTDGTAAIFFDNVSILQKQLIKDAWNTGADETAEVLSRYDAETCFAFAPGPRGMSDGYLASILQRLSYEAIKRNSLGQRQRVIDRLEKQSREMHVGYPLAHQALYQEHTDLQKQIIYYLSADAGQYQTGFELFNTTVTESQQAVILDTDISATSHKPAHTPESITGEIKETFTDIAAYNRVIYRLDGKTLPELYKKYPFNQSANAGGLTYYFLLETDNQTFAIGAPDDVPLVETPVPVTEDARMHIVRTRGFPSYHTEFQEVLEGIDGFPHVSIPSLALDLYYQNINQLQATAEKLQDNYLLTLNFAGTAAPTFYPTGIEYKV